MAYAITSTPATEADAELLLKRWRAQWQIENGLHWVRDVTLGEGAGLILKGQAALLFAVMRNSALSLLTTWNMPSLSAAMRHLGS